VHKDALSKKLVWNAREMRKNPTRAEEVLWEQLRFDQLGVRFRRQHPISGKILDFYCHDAQLGIELDGGIHLQKEQRESDKEKEYILNELHGIRILRFRNDEVLDHLEKVLETIRKELLKSSPPPSGEGLGVGENHGQRVGIRIIDIGTGGGFPLLPLAITLPEARLMGVDATQKKIDAVSRIVEHLKLSNVSLISGRSEELGHDPNLREQFDVVLSRAVADTSVLLEYCSPFTKLGGFVILWKSTKMERELQDSLLARAELSCHLVMQHVYELPEGFGERQLLVFEKGGILPAKYPRPVGIPSKKPLQ
jgi:16S rRNA (guanine527-N7)-methyltransferase